MTRARGRALTSAAGLLLLLAPLARAGAQGIDSIRLRQAYVRLPEVVAYVDVVSAPGQKALGLSQNQFAATLGGRPLDLVSVTPFKKEEGVAYLFLVDVSKSLSPERFEQLRAGLTNWVSGLGAKDRAAIMTFGSAVRMRQDFTGDKPKLQAAIGTLALTDNNTALYQAIDEAMRIEQRSDSGLPARRVAVLLSDGLDDSKGMTKAEVLENLRGRRVPLYTIGYLTPPRTAAKLAGMQTLAEFARRTGGSYADAGEVPLQDVFARLNAQVGRALVMRMKCGRCSADITPQPMVVTLSTGTQRLSTDPLPATVLRAPGRRWPVPPWLLALMLVALVSIGVGIYLVMRRTPQPAPPPIPPPIPPPDFSQPPEQQMLVPDGVGAIGGAGAVAGAGPEVDAQGAGPQVADDGRDGQQAPEPDDVWGQPEDQGRAATVPQGGATPHLPDPTKAPTSAYKPVVISGPSVRVQLTVTNSGRAGPRVREVVVYNHHVIGRAADVEVSFPDDQRMSSRHCELVLQSGVVLVRDLGSRNGTLVNGVPIRAGHRLEDGDVILVGDTELRVTGVGAGVIRSK